MSEVLVLVVAALDAAGGQTTYPEVFATLDFKQQQQLPQAIREGKKSGVLRQEIVVTETGNVHMLYKL